MLDNIKFTNILDNIKKCHLALHLSRSILSLKNSQNISLNDLQNTNLNNIKPSVLTLALAANILL